MSHFITYKDIDHERLGDAPFIGALVIAAQCHGPCKNCFNLDLRQAPNKFATAEQIIQTILENPFNEGIILGGLEWTEQPDDLIDLLLTSIWYSDRLQRMLYTRLTEEQFAEQFPQIYQKIPMWYKFGEYDESQSDDHYYSHGIKLATRNQKVVFIGGQNDQSTRNN